jgi:hypothetical protein
MLEVPGQVKLFPLQSCFLRGWHLCVATNEPQRSTVLPGCAQAIPTVDGMACAPLFT